jgi:serine/threonine protein kinase
MPANQASRINSFDFKPGRLITKKYEIVERLGSGWEGEVYKIIERGTDIIRAAKLFYPHRNRNDRSARLHAKKLHKLRHCPILIQYHTSEEIVYRRTPITVLISEYVEGEKLSEFINRQPGRRLPPFQALHLLYDLITGIEPIHQAREYHGDLHTENIIVRRYGLGFELKLVDFYHWSAPKRENMQADIIDVIRVFYDILGGARHYSKQPKPIKNICCGLKHGLILKKFPTISRLRNHIKTMEWD